MSKKDRKQALKLAARVLTNSRYIVHSEDMMEVFINFIFEV